MALRPSVDPLATCATRKSRDRHGLSRLNRSMTLSTTELNGADPAASVVSSEVRLAALHGLRHSELLGLHWSTVNLTDGTVDQCSRGRI